MCFATLITATAINLQSVYPTGMEAIRLDAGSFALVSFFDCHIIGHFLTV